MYVLSSYPGQLLKYLKGRRCRFQIDKKHKWLRWGTAAGQDIAMVICRDLPLEEPYFRWLLFAPAGSQKWQEFVKLLLERNEIGLLEKVAKLKPKELNIMVSKLGKVKTAEPYDKQKEMIELIKTLLGLVENNEENIDEVLEAFSPEQRKSLLQRLLKEQDKNN